MNHDTNNNFIPFPQDPEFNFREILTTKIQSAFAITGRLGYSVSPNWLVYVKGGYAIGEIKTSAEFLQPSIPQSSIGPIRAGMAAGPQAQAWNIDCSTM
jgi:opacity protein-like surface antigen